MPGSRAPVLLAVLMIMMMSPTSALIWKPVNPANKMWDTWPFFQPKHPTTPFYLGYLSSCDASCGGPTGGSWNGVGAALSMDGVHYADMGVVIHKDPNATWLGSGSVLLTANGTYVMNFSEEYDCVGASGKQNDGCQSIFFATTTDLEKGWTRVPFAPPPADDPNVFKYGPGYKVGGRWDCIATVPKPSAPGEFYGYWTATPNAGVGAGVGQTVDLTGTKWEALPPITKGFPSGEVGSVVVISNHYYMLFGGGHLYTSASPVSGFVIDGVNPAFHADGYGVAFTRLWNVQDDPNQTVLVSHQWIASPDIYLAPLKQAVVGTDGTLRAMYWPGNERLKGQPIALNPTNATTASSSIVVTECDNASMTPWNVPAASGPPGPISHGAKCLGQRAVGGWGRTLVQVVLLPCQDPNALRFTIHTNGTISANVAASTLCLGVSPAAQVVLGSCITANSAWKTRSGRLELITGSPLRPVALWQFENETDLGRNTGAGGGASTSPNGSEGLVCAGGARCTLALNNGARSRALHLTAASYLEFNHSIGVPEGVPISDAPYTVAGWVYPDQSVATHTRRGRAGAMSAGTMMGMVGWGDWATSGRSNAFATSLPGGFWNYWFNNGYEPRYDMEFPAPGIGSEWGHVLCRAAAGRRDCFWNGVLAKSDTPPPHDAVAATFRVGSTHMAEYFEGLIDDVAIFNESLSDELVLQAVLGNYATPDKPNGPDMCLSIPAPAPPNTHTVAVTVLSTNVDVAVGVVVEGTLSCANANTTAGFFVGSSGATDSGTAFLFDCASQIFQIGGVSAGSSFAPAASFDRKPGFATGHDVRLRLLLRASSSGAGMAEFYANDVMSHPYTFGTIRASATSPLGTIGVVSAVGSDDAVDLTTVHAWRMTLPAV